ncbi:MAG TPA: hypothetical protein VGM84_27150 [Steroidobacteraceae bacterium]
MSSERPRPHPARVDEPPPLEPPPPVQDPDPSQSPSDPAEEDPGPMEQR